ncbi:MAG: hypothetical protein Wins2KO_22820 [Winogradskyella sp.]
MKLFKILSLVTILFVATQTSSSQTLNWYSIENATHILTASIGWDYGITYNIGYAYKLKAKLPIALTANFSIPSGEDLLDDFKTKIGGQISILNKSDFKGIITVNGIYRRYRNPLVQLQNFGSEFKGTLGYYRPKWFLAGEIGFDKAIVTHFNHSEEFKDIYPDVKNGWYEPSTGGNFSYGIQSGYSFNNSDFILGLGLLTTQDLKTSPSIPYYFMLGYNYRLN